MTKLRVLALHGFGQNANIFRTQIAAICRRCADDVEFVFLDGPVILHPPDQPTGSLVDDDGYPYPARQLVVDEAAPRGWCTFNENKTRYWGIEEAFQPVISVLRRDRFDGVVGFSQGAALAAYLCAYLEDPSAHALFNPPFHPPFKFAILASSFLPIDPPLPHRIRTPTLHVLGRHDTHIGRAESWPLVEACLNPRVETHPGGHFIGTKPSWRQFFHQWIMAFSPDSIVEPQDVPGPVPKVLPEPVYVDPATPDDTPLSTPTAPAPLDLSAKWMFWTPERIEVL